MRKNLFYIVSLVIIASLVTACGVARLGVNQFNEGKRLYLEANTAYSNFMLCVDTETNMIGYTFQLSNTYFWAEIQKVEQYRAAQAEFQAIKDARGGLPMATTQDGQQVVDFNKLPEGASPNSIVNGATQGMGGLTIAVNALQEAQIPNIPPEVYLASLDAIQVSNNHIFQCGVTWNNAVLAYNVWRGQVTGRIIGDLANYFGIDTMPTTLPQYTGTTYHPGGGIPTPAGIPIAPTP